MPSVRLTYLLAVFFLLVSPSFGQTMMEARRLLLQAEDFLQKKSAPEALEKISEGLEILGSLKFEATPLASDFYQSQARANRLLHDDAKTVTSFEKALAIVEPLAQSEEKRYRQILLEYGDYQRGQQRNDKAISLYLKALLLEPRALKSERLETTKLLHNLACAYRDRGDLNLAFETFEETLNRKEHLLAKDDPSLAITLGELGGVCRLLGRFELAERYLLRALEIRKAQKESSPLHYALSLNNLSLLKQVTGEHQEALRLIKESCEIFLREYGPHHLETLVPQMNLAQAHSSVGQFEQAEQLYGEALALARTHFRRDSLEVAAVTHNLGTLMLEMNDLEKAQAYLEETLAIRRQRLSEVHQDLGPSLINLATLHRKAGRYEQALDLYREALSVGQKALGPAHPDLAYILDLMAGLPSLADKPNEVWALTQQAYEIRRKAFGPKATLTAQSIHSLALLSHDRGDLKKAQDLFNTSLEVFRKELGPNHPFTGKAARRLGILAFEQGERELALSYAAQEARVLLATTEEIFSFASERQRLAFSLQLKPYDLFASIGASSEIATAVLRYKGAVLDSIMEDLALARGSDNPAVQGRLEALLRVRERLSVLLGEPNEEPKSSLNRSPREAETMVELRDELERLEIALARDGYGSQELRSTFRVTPEEVIKSLPRGSALIEFVRYGHLLERGKVEDSYGAVILSRGKEPIWKYLGSAREIEAMTWRYKRFIRGRGAEASGRGELLRELHNKIWYPLEEALPSDTTTVFLSPDSELSFVSFATLLGEDDQFLGQRYDLLYVASGRDLLRNISTESSQEAVLFGDPVFADRSLEPLPFTRWECQELGTMFKALPGWNVKEFLGERASEAQVKAIRRPSHLHIATHGYFEAWSRGSNRDPMAASGLLLSAGRLKDGKGQNEDGYLTAGEVSLLDLRGTSLVTLSACDTGLGVAQAGEGVLGLRRGFIKAGARHLVMTLWPVSDDTTASFMRDFVTRAQEVPPALALAQVQREWLIRLSEERAPVLAAREVGSFVLNLQGGWADAP